MTQRFSYQDVYNFVLSKGCLLLSKDYINMKQQLEFKCSCGKPFETNLDSFKNKNMNHCKDCTNKKKSESKKLDYNYVKNFINEHECQLISQTYSNAHEKLNLICSCGEPFEKSWNKFKNGQRKCKKCTNKDNEWNYDNVKKFVEIESESGCILLSSKSDYENRATKLQFLCNCGESFPTTFHSFYYSNKRQCEKCRIEIVREKAKKGIDYLKNYVNEKSTAKLLSEDYDDYHHDLEFECECGETFTTSFVAFMNGKTRCFSCSPKSKMEERARIFFESYDIIYIPQKTFDTLKGINGYKLRFDYAILNIQGELDCLIELDGEHHFMPIRGHGGDKKHKTLLVHDNLKNEYCIKNNIKLYRISYKEKENLEEILSNILLKS